jgi:hypothetical protein
MGAQQLETIIVLLCAIGSLVIATATLVWFMADQFKKSRAEFWKGITALHNTMTEQLDDHENKDDRRFERITDQLFEIQIRNARKDGDPLPPRPSPPSI